jgi:hypothetical protein
VRVHHVAGDLGHGEHVDEVEEELEVGGGIVLAGGASAAEDPGATFACFGDDDHLFLAPLCQGVIASTLPDYSVLASWHPHRANASRSPSKRSSQNPVQAKFREFHSSRYLGE